MKITKLRKSGQKLTGQKLTNLIDRIESVMESMGFIVQGEALNSSSIKLSHNRMQFSIDVDKLGYNTRYSSGLSPKRTRCPAWSQRVKFNNELNKIMDTFDITCKITSGPFLIRDGYRVCLESNWEDQKPDYIRQNEINGHYIVERDYKKVRA